MKPLKLLSYLFISFTLISGCIDLSDSEQAELKSFLDGYAEEENEEVSLSDARDKDYLGNTDVSVADTQGSARIGGEVAVSSLEDPTQANALGMANMSSRAQGRAVDTLTSGSFTVSFINGSGQKETIVAGNYTVLIHYPSDGSDPQFIIEGLGDGINYIVEVAVTVDGEDLSLKSVAFVPPGATKSEKAVIDPISTVVAEAVQEKVTSGFFATGGEKFSQDYISDLNETMTAIIEEVIADPDNGVTLTNFEVAITSDTGVDSLVTKLLADEDVNEGLDVLEAVAVEEKFEAPEAGEITDAQVARDYIVNLFEQLFKDDGGGDSGGDEGNQGGGNQGGGDEGGIPKVFTDTFGDAFFAGEVRTIDQVMGAVSDMVTPESGVSPFGTTEQNAALTEFKQLFVDVFGGLAAIDQLENLESLTTSQQMELDQIREELSDMPAMLLAIFPPARAAEIAAFTASSNVTVPEAVTLIFFSIGQIEGDGNDGGNNGGDGDNPYKLLELYGFDLANVDAEYKQPEVYGLEIHPGRMWNGTSEIDVLNLHTCVDLPEFVDGVVNSASLVYPTSSGPSDPLVLKKMSDYYQQPPAGGEGGEGGHEDKCYVWDTWQEQRLLEEDPTYSRVPTDDNPNDKDWDAIIAALDANGSIIQDFTSGDYVLTVNYTLTGGAATDIDFTFNKTIISGLSQLNPRLTTPASPPRHPEGNLSDAEWTAYHTAQNAFEMTVFPVGGIGTIAWDAPASLNTIIAEHTVEGKPTILAAYNLDIGRHVCGDDPYTDDVVETDWCGWKTIFNTWEDNTQIFDTQFELPSAVKAQLVELDVNDEPYSVNLGITFLDARTGQYLGNGGWSWAQFRVGQAIQLTDEFTLTGTLTNVPNSEHQDKDGVAYPASAYKVALIKESCDHSVNGSGQCSQTTLANAVIEGANYTITTTFGDVKNTDGSWVNIIMYIDADENGEFTQGTEANDFMWEPQFWAMNHVNFNTWGGVLRINYNNCNHSTGECTFSEEAVVPNGAYEGPDFDTMPEEFNDGGTAVPQ